MNKRILKPATLSLTLLFAAATMSFAQENNASTKDRAAAAAADAPAAAALVQPSTEAKIAPATATEAKVAAQPNDAEMMAKMMELSKLNDNHKLLAGMVGTWSYTVKMWMDPKGNPSESTGTAVRKSVMDGRYVSGDYSGKFKMPGADGKMKDMNFHGMSLDGYDNVKQKFVSSWIDNMGTMIMMSEGTYDAASKTFTYNAQCEMMPGMNVKIRELLKVVDANHHTFEYFEDRGTGEAKTMEIDYTRSKK
jgi:hypothetical protein